MLTIMSLSLQCCPRGGNNSLCLKWHNTGIMVFVKIGSLAISLVFRMWIMSCRLSQSCVWLVFYEVPEAELLCFVVRFYFVAHFLLSFFVFLYFILFFLCFITIAFIFIIIFSQANCCEDFLCYDRYCNRWNFKPYFSIMLSLTDLWLFFCYYCIIIRLLDSAISWCHMIWWWYVVFIM